MLLARENSAFILIDVQEKLSPHVAESAALIKRCSWLLDLANEMDVPALITEQYPRGLGPTVEPLRRQDLPLIEKVHFSCMGEPNFALGLQSLQRQQVVLAGIETHVCVLQTAIQLRECGYQVFVIIDAVSSRNPQDKKYGLKRMQQAGCQLVTAEMVLFEWLRQAGTAEFKAISNRFLK